MNMDFGLFQQQTMKLAMTNELRQAITILQYSTQELVSFIEEQQLENPLLEIQDQYIRNSKLSEGVSPIDFASRNVITLQDHLIQQVSLLSLEKRDREIIDYLIYSLDENGYLAIDISEVMNRFFLDETEVLQNLKVVQSLEPNGVGARSLKECLLLQLKKLKPRDILTEAVVEHYLDMFANKKWQKIAKLLSIELEDMQTIADRIQRLNPKPGAIFYHEPPTFVAPEIFIEFIDGELSISYNDSLLPKLTVNRQLFDLASDEIATKYIQQKHQQILWLLKSIDQRQQTLIKVTEAIANYQKDFFRYGYDYLKPLTLKEIAATIDMHESTVSRVTTQKYVQTPKGLFELKYFFSSSLKGESGSSASSITVKELIKKMVDKENKQKPLSDQKIVSLLEKDHSIEISRRTVTKYREEMNIPSSSKRKRFV